MVIKSARMNYRQWAIRDLVPFSGSVGHLNIPRARRAFRIICMWTRTAGRLSHILLLVLSSDGLSLSYWCWWQKFYVHILLWCVFGVSNRCVPNPQYFKVSLVDNSFAMPFCHRLHSDDPFSTLISSQSILSIDGQHRWSTNFMFSNVNISIGEHREIIKTYKFS